MRRLLMISLLLAPPAAFSQSLITIPPQQCVWHEGDSPTWAAPDLDDSGWQPLSTWKRQSSSPRFWIRCHADLSALRSAAAPAVAITFYNAYELYLNGGFTGSAGNLSRAGFDLNSIRSFPIEDGKILSGPSVIALRVANRVLLTNSGPINGLVTGRFELSAGDASMLDALRARAVLTRSSQYFGAAMCFSIVGVMAMMLLVLYLYDRRRREFLLLSVACLLLTAVRLNELATAAYLPYPIAVCLFIVFAANVGMCLTIYPFYFALANRRPGPMVWTLMVINCLCYIPNGVDVLGVSGLSLWFGDLSLWLVRTLSLTLHSVLSCFAFVVFWPYRLIPRRVRPLAVLCMLWATADLLWFLAEATAIPIPGIPNVFATWGVPLIEVRAFTTAGVITVLLGLLLRDQRRTALERASLTAELEAARVVQQVMIPEETPDVPGFRIESVYKPASQVGGDFFQILATPNNGALIAIGDVSGKGMPAAMTVSLLVGTFRTLARYTQSPGEILVAMNRLMQARSAGGFTTCLVMRIDADGMLSAANAGHLLPYLAGGEMAIDNGLPLGLAADAQYPESRFNLGASSHVTLVTDGVVEARNATGELFGFDRTRAISTQSAENIARAASTFGQEDDITVLTLTFAPAAVAHA